MSLPTRVLTSYHFGFSYCLICPCSLSARLLERAVSTCSFHFLTPGRLQSGFYTPPPACVSILSPVSAVAHQVSSSLDGASDTAEPPVSFPLLHCHCLSAPSFFSLPVLLMVLALSPTPLFFQENSRAPVALMTPLVRESWDEEKRLSRSGEYARPWIRPLVGYWGGE